MSVAVQTEGDTTRPYQLQYHWLHKVTDAELLTKEAMRFEVAV